MCVMLKFKSFCVGMVCGCGCGCCVCVCVRMCVHAWWMQKSSAVIDRGARHTHAPWESPDDHSRSRRHRCARAHAYNVHAHTHP